VTLDQSILKSGLLAILLKPNTSYGIVGIKFDKKVRDKILAVVANVVEQTTISKKLKK
jgi:hypothetical protein